MNRLRPVLFRAIALMTMMVTMPATVHAVEPMPQDDAPAAVPTGAAPPTKVPSADEARAAFAAFQADPLNRLDRTEPFLNFIRDSGQVHMVLNNDLLAWMYAPIDPNLKAVLYAAFLGGNMHAQLAHKDELSSGDDVAGMTSALAAYAAIRAAHPDFKLPLFDQLASAQAAQQLDAAVSRITGNAATKP